jgi:hypothetical protein
MTAHRDAGILTAKKKEEYKRKCFQSPNNKKPLGTAPAF